MTGTQLSLIEERCIIDMGERGLGIETECHASERSFFVFFFSLIRYGWILIGPHDDVR